MIDQIKNHLQFELVSEGAFDIKGKIISEEQIIECKKELCESVLSAKTFFFYR